MTPRTHRPSFAVLSDVGLVREHNEDAVLAQPPLFAVADGLGGHLAGEVASRIAVGALEAEAPHTPDPKALARAVRAANAAVIEAAEEGRGRSGMGTTLTAAVVVGTRIAIAQVGDSRAYLLSSQGLERLTQDHSMVADMIRRGTLTEEEARFHPNRSVITRALGSDPNMYADTYDVEAEPGDRLLLASDGLTGMLRDGEIAEILRSTTDPEEAAHALVTAANGAGGHDNISVVIVDIEGRGRGAGPVVADQTTRARAANREDRAKSARAWFAAVAFAVLVGLVIFGSVYLTRHYAESQAYLTAEDGYVVVYRGLPGELAGFKLRWREIETTIPVDALDPVVAGRLTGAIRVESMAAARKLLDEYRAQVVTATPDGSTLVPEPLPTTPTSP